MKISYTITDLAREFGVTTRTIRRRFLGLPGRLTRSARLVTLHLPARWPWAERFQLALARLRAIPIAA